MLNNTNTILQIIDETSLVYKEDGEILDEKSISDCKSFINNTDIPIPDYVDFHPSGWIMLIWHVAKKGIAGLLFTGDHKLTYTYTLKNSEDGFGDLLITESPTKFIEIVEALND